jgi:hypothetical protein
MCTAPLPACCSSGQEERGALPQRSCRPHRVRVLLVKSDPCRAGPPRARLDAYWRLMRGCGLPVRESHSTMFDRSCGHCPCPARCHGAAGGAPGGAHALVPGAVPAVLRPAAARSRARPSTSLPACRWPPPIPLGAGLCSAVPSKSRTGRARRTEAISPCLRKAAGRRHAPWRLP